MIIGFTGLAGSGKTTASQHVLDKFDGMFVKVNFKDGLVKELKQNFPDTLQALVDEYETNEVQNIDDLFTVKPPIMRALMQNYGTEVRRGDNDRYWVQQWAKSVSSSGKNVVVDDVRFQNEADAVKLSGGIIIKIVRTDITNAGNHISETEQSLIEPDFVIEVDKGEHDKLYEQLDAIISNYI